MLKWRSQKMNLNDVQFAPNYQEAYKAAETECINNKIGYLVVEHMVYHCLANTEFASKLLNIIDFEQLLSIKKGLIKYLDEYFPLLKVADEELAWINETSKPLMVGEFELDVENKAAFILFLSPLLSKLELNSLVPLAGRTEKFLCIESFFIAILMEEESYACKLLLNNGLSKENLEKLFYIPASEEAKKETGDVVFKYCSNLFKVVMAKKPIVVGREQEVSKLGEIFSRKDKNNVIISGGAGIGKTTVIEKMILEMSEKNFAPLLNKNQVLCLDMGALIAGTKFRGEFEERIDALVKALMAQKKNTILVIENIHLVVGSGNANGMDLAHFLMPLLSCPQVKVIGTTSQESWRRIIEDQKSFSRYFEKIDLGQVLDTETHRILQAKVKELEAHHRVSFDPNVFTAVIELTNKFLPKRYQPESSLDVLDRAGAKLSLTIQRKLSTPNKVTLEIIQETLAEMTKIPSIKIAQSETKSILNLNSKLNAVVFGQAPAIQKLHQSILISKSGLRENQKTIGSFLFIGSTGVGKTEVAKCLASELSLPFLRFDMSEYSEAHSISKLIGAPAGYVGYGKGGLLSEAIEENPHAVVLIDELEKAHPEIFNLFLQIMDNGSFRDAQGRNINCQQIFLIMTSNLGAGEINKKSVGLNNALKEVDTKKFLQKHLKPEFLNRFDALINFNNLSKEEFYKIFDKHLGDLNKLISKSNLVLEVDPAVVELLINQGMAENLGARPLKRLVETQLKQHLALRILEGTSNQKITAILKEDQIEFTYDNL